jgi:lipid II isoglutaminyl synthase (glutamine-hydrolysing)
MKLVICHLYPDLMNMYGDRGNVTALVQRCLWRNIEVAVSALYLKEMLDSEKYDLVFMGGGQDKEQKLVSEDFQKVKGEGLKETAAAGKVILGICGGYQLFGQYYKMKSGQELPGIGILDLYTIAGDKRMIGNAVIKINSKLKVPQPRQAKRGGQSSKLDTLVGFENHSGKTFLGKNCQPLGIVKIGYGNNGEDKQEGASQNNVFGTYLHGSFLPKNPHFADYLISLALTKKYGKIKLETIDDQLELKAHKAAYKRAKKTKTLHL